MSMGTSVMTTSPPPSPHTSGSPRRATSLLDRRSSHTFVVPDNTDVLTTTTPTPTTVPSSDPTLFVSNATAMGTAVRAPRPSSSALLPFVPLTPIIASPRLTPDIGSGPGPAALAQLNCDLDGSDSVDGSNTVIPETIIVQSPSVEDDLHVSDVVRTVESLGGCLEAPIPMPPPSWTSTPPTPPMKGVSPTRSEGSSPSRKRSRSRQGHQRPASVAVFPAYRPPTPPPLYLFGPTPSTSNTATMSAQRSQSAAVTRDSSFDELRSADVKRRQSLPCNFGKQLVFCADGEASCLVSERSSETLRVERGREVDGVLPPSLSRHSDCRRGRSSDRSPLGVSVVTREDSAGSARFRPKFTLDDGDASEGENDGDDVGAPSTEAGGESVEDDDAKLAEGQMQMHRERERVGMKRYHALMELLTTEVGYLMDLRALVTIYLAHLPSLNTPIPSSALSRPSPSALSISSLSRSRLPSSRSSILQLPPSAGPGPPLSDCPSSFFDKYYEASVDRDPEKERGKGDKEKQARRAIFSDADLQTVRRNAEQLLQLHQRFVDILREKLEPLGYGSAFMEVSAGREKESSIDDAWIGLGVVDEAIEAVAEAFSHEASSFGIYESFCPGHNEALTLVRSMQERYPIEWDAYEQRCSLRVAYEFELAVQRLPATNRTASPVPQTSPVPSTSSESLRRKRRHSTSSVALPSAQAPFGAVTTSSSNLNVMSSNKSEPTSGHKRKASGSFTSATGGGQAGRLKFLDYLIKPVQRLCKYPLLLDQLRIKRKQPEVEPDLGTIENACSAMRAVVARVDKASERRAHQVRSALIVSRLVPSSPASPTSSSADGHDEKRVQLTAEFLRSLGVCLLAGALEVIYPQSGGGLRGKYLAAFLYIGGYLVLAKVPKGGKAYDPRHWFPLSGFEVMDEEEDDPALPYAFHLYSPGYHLHLAAACQLEKTVWMAAIQDAQAVRVSEWPNEPAANIPADDRPPMSATEESGPDWPLPTIQSMSDMEMTPDPSVPAPPLSSPRKLAKTVSRVDGAAIREYQLSALNRRTSTSSVKAFFAPLSFDSRITRPSSQIRQQVDHGLHDVLSETFITVRSQAQMRDEELFQLRRKPGNMSRSNSGLSISGAFTTRRRHDSIVLTHRRKGSLDGVPDIIGDPEMAQKPLPVSLSKRPKSVVAKRRGKLPLSVVPSQSSYVDGEVPIVQSPEGSLEAPSPLTHCSSTSSSNAGSTLPSPMDLTIPLPMPSPMSSPSDPRKMDYRPKRARSMVDNVKHFFHTRSISPTPSNERSPKIAVVSLDMEADTPGGLVQWWRRGSLRRRVQSSPEVPTDDSSPCTPGASSEDSHLSSSAVPSTSSSTPCQEPTATPPRATPRRVAFSDATPIRRRSLFGFSSRSDFKSSASTESALVRSKTLKNMLLFQRSNSFTRNTDPDS